MPSVGAFGTRKVEEEDQGVEPMTFEWFDVPIRLATQFSQIKLVNLMEAARSVDEKDPMSLVIVKDMFRTIIYSGDFQSFWKICEQEDQDLGDLIAVFETLFEALTGHPTQLQSASSPGLQEAQESSPADSPTPATRGRPDLQNLMNGGADTRAKIAAAIQG
jgi:hypothetical protein